MLLYNKGRFYGFDISCGSIGRSGSDHVISVFYNSEKFRKISKIERSWDGEIRPITRVFLFDF